jgi:hypothetical protein
MIVWKSLITPPAGETTIQEKILFSHEPSPGVYKLGLALSMDSFDF